ncbi:MAG TPA: phosphopyruvate hydratase [Candidatus Eisenbergiella merdigallinarum]|uniref:Enolase n=1 Tax=Candidatus Eisenbergiella merdigallinarum TaxID=2838552 RepID=A0A9D2MP30_9FIRM|nr:phosphopyruvate hydratase [Candidatus Eisenbergiella merdigallinarum]
MNVKLPVREVHAREILDSRGNPTLEAEVVVENSVTGELACGRASVPSGASTGQFEAVELRDGEVRYFGLGVRRAVGNVNAKLREALLSQDASCQRKIDERILDCDGTQNKENLGANACLGVSMAAARAAAEALHLPLYQYLGGIHTVRMPVPMMNILNGGKHADNTVDLQEFMIAPVQAESFAEGLRVCAEIYHNLKGLCREKGLSTGVGDEGGFAPDLPDAESVLSLIVEAVEKSGYAPGHDIKIAIDAAASELYDKRAGCYCFPGESKMKGKQVLRSAEDMIAYYEGLAREFPLFSLEDGLDEEDWDGWQQLTKRLGNRLQLVGDDLFVTNVKRLAAGIQKGAGNAILVKVNQIGTLTEAFAAVRLAKENGFGTIISHRSGETEDAIIADIAVAVNAGQIKTGAPCRMDRVAKYNRLLRIEEELYPGR